VLINEVVSSVNIFLATAAATTCPNADQNGDGQVLINEVVGAVNSFLDAATCPMVAGGKPTPTGPPAATNTPTRTSTLPPTPTASPTATQGAAVCGDGVVQAAAGEECDLGGTCTGGTNAGIHCTAESDCIGEGVCLEGVKIGWVCSNDTDCPGSTCIHCKTFGGKGCSANCTNETDIKYNLVPGETTKLCLGGKNDSQPCVVAADCPVGVCATQVKPGTTGSFVHDGFVQLALPLKGFQTSTMGKLRGGRITAVIKAVNSSLDRVQVAALACACVRSVAAKSCGGTLFEKDGTGSIGCSPDYTPGDSVCAPPKKPCSFIHGEGNATSGVIGCSPAGLAGINLDATQESNGQVTYRFCASGTNIGAQCTVPDNCQPGALCSGGANTGKPCTTAANCPGGACGCALVPPPTPPAGAGPAYITLHDAGGPGSAILLNSSAIATVTGNCSCTGGCLTNPITSPLYGADHEFCKFNGIDDDPQSARGQPSTLPQVTGKATGIITNTKQSTQTHFCDKERTKTCTKDADCGANGPCTFEIGPYSYTGLPYDCSRLTAPTPSTQGGTVAGAFTQLNQTATGDIVVRNVFVAGAPRP
jgi:hypothetical protein